jgi:hypothetical protein
MTVATYFTRPRLAGEDAHLIEQAVIGAMALPGLDKASDLYAVPT